MTLCCGVPGIVMMWTGYTDFLQNSNSSTLDDVLQNY